MEIKGTLEAIFETKEFKSGFKKREFVINTGGDYPQSIKMEVVKDNINKLDAMAVGTPVECKIDIRGRLYEGNYYNNILAWSIFCKDIFSKNFLASACSALAKVAGLP